MIRPLEITLPGDLNEALSVLSKNENAGIIAGGTDVVPGLRQGSGRFENTSLLIDINRIKELKGISISKRGISIGAGETFSSIIADPVVKKELPLLVKACGTIGSMQIRNRATIAGNFVNNAPCADSVPALLAYDTLIEITSLDGKRELFLREFLKSPYKTQLKKGEIVTKIIVPIPEKEYKYDFYKLGRRRAVAISRITLALLIHMEGNLINEIRIASGAVTPIGARFSELEKFAQGKSVNEKLLKDISSGLGKNILDITGLRWSSEYKLPVVQQVFYEMLHKTIYGGSNE